MPGLAGLVLAAGSGRRFGGPKALVDTGSGPWVRHALDVVASCSRRYVVAGAGGAEVATVVGADAVVVQNPAHATGMASSLQVGLSVVAAAAEYDAVLVMLVDLPDVPRAAADRLVAAAGLGPSVLARAGYGGRPGHPVLIGRDHFAGVLGTLHGDRGAAAYLSGHGVVLVECGDLASGQDVDRPPGSPGSARLAD